MINAFTHFLIFFGGSMSWTLAIGQIMERERKFFNYMFAVFLFSIGVCQFYSGLVVTEQLTKYSTLGFIHLPFLCLTGPSFYLCFKSVFWQNFKFRKKDVFHSVSVIIVIILIIPLIFEDETVKIEVLKNPPSFRSGNFMRTYYSFILAKIIIDGLGYLITFLRECSFLISIRYIRENKVPPVLIAVMCLLYISGILYATSVIINNFIADVSVFYHTIIEILSIMLLLVVLLIYYMSAGHDNYFRVLRNQEEKNRYEKSRIKNLNVSEVLVRLKHLMEEEKIYKNENINLNNLAIMIGVESYQLSQIINEKFKQNFNSYINRYRIEEAKKLLLEDSRRTIFSVSYTVGFNSPSPFYEWFQKLTGLSPSKFRKQKSENR